MTYGPGRGEVYPRPVEVDPDEPTDRDLITGHPFQLGRWGDLCVHVADGWVCGYAQAEHERLEGVTRGGEAIERP